MNVKDPNHQGFLSTSFRIVITYIFLRVGYLSMHLNEWPGRLLSINTLCPLKLKTLHAFNKPSLHHSMALHTLKVIFHLSI